MKKKIVSILVCMLLFVTVSSVTGTMNDDFDANFNASENKISQSGRAQWDIQFAYDVETPTGEQSLTGCEFDGTHFLVSEWGFSGATQPRVVSKLDSDGNLVSQWTPTWISGGSGGLRDLAYDGQYFYGGNTGNTIYCFDVDGNLITSWSSPGAVRSIAYDEDYDAFWINNWQETLQLVDRSGSTLYTITSPPSMYASAWEKQCDGTPTLWIHAGTTSGGGCWVEKYVDLYTGGTNLGNQHSVSGDFGTAAIAGGLFYTDQYEPGYGTLGGIAQMSPDTLFGYELCVITNSPPDIPSTPSGPTTGLIGTPYTYSSTTTDPEGDQVAYWFDWGDTTNSGWTSFVPSGDPGNATKQWTSPGTYQVTAKAKDIGDHESGFSAPLTVVISSGPILDIGTITGGLFRVSAPINNIGDDTATNVQWTIDLVGGAFIGGSSSGTEPSIAAAGSVTVQSGLIIGLGSTTVTVTATCDEGSSDTKSQTGFVFLIFIIVN